MSSHADSFASSGRPTSQPDFVVEDYFSIFLIRPLPPAAQSWLEENIETAGSFQPYWPTVVVEYRYISDVAQGIAASGFKVQR
jgi:hypothetical protein